MGSALGRHTHSCRRPLIPGALRRVLAAVREVLSAHPDVAGVLPLPDEPSVRADVTGVLGGQERAVITGPLDYPDLIWVLARSALAVSDSGTVQEEAPEFGVPVLVLREATERMEAVYAGAAVLVGTDRAEIVSRAGRVLAGPRDPARTSGRDYPFGDGQAAGRAATAIARLLGRGAGGGAVDAPAGRPGRGPAR